MNRTFNIALVLDAAYYALRLDEKYENFQEAVNKVLDGCEPGNTKRPNFGLIWPNQPNFFCKLEF